MISIWRMVNLGFIGEVYKNPTLNASYIWQWQRKFLLKYSNEVFTWNLYKTKISS